jgi:hypothetical protein
LSGDALGFGGERAIVIESCITKRSCQHGDNL